MSHAVLETDVLDLKRVLAQSSYPDLRRLRITASENIVTLSGIVPSFFLKQVAQESLRTCLGGRRLINNVVVVPGK